MKTTQKIASLLLALFLIPIFPAYAVEAGYTVFHGSRDKPDIAITVDDCYNIENVQAILALCEEHGVPVTFFVIGSALKTKDGPVWQSAIDMGCEIGNHTWSHPQLYKLNSREIKSQLRRTQDKLDRILGHHYPMQVMRPPTGRLSADPAKKSDIWVVEAIEAAGYLHAVRWDVSQTNPDKAIRQVQNGSILLYHANKKDIRCLKQLIPDLLDAGYHCVTVSELLGLTAPESTWTVEEEILPIP